jgi:hypothetical protein
MAGGAVQIAILGAGLVGSTLGRLWNAVGHDVTFAARDAARPRALAAELGQRAHAASVADAVAGAEVVLVAIPGPAVTDVLQAVGPLDGRVMIDAANSFGQQQVTLRSLADAFPQARWARAFNSLSASIMADDNHRKPPWVMFLSDAVVQVTLKDAAGAVEGGDDARARGHQLGAAFRVRDRGRGQLGEVGDALLRVRGEGTAPRRGDDRAPHAPADVDRAGHRGAEPLPARMVGQLALQSGKVIDAGRPPGPEDLRDRQRGLDGPAARQGGVGAHTSEDRRRRVGLETSDRGDVGTKKLAYLAGDLREDLGWRGRTGDEHRHPSQGSVLIGDLLQVRDGGTHERDQASDVPLTGGRQPPGLRCRSDGNTPQTALERDRRPNT